MPSVNQLLNIKCKLVVIFMSIYTCTLKCNKNREIIKDFENELMIKIFLSMKNEKKNHILHHNIPKLKCTKNWQSQPRKKKDSIVYIK